MALAKVREDKEREAGDGFDGSWVAHPDLVPVCREIFDRRARRPARTSSTGRREDVRVDGRAAARRRATAGGAVTEAGLRGNVDVGAALPRGVAARQRRGRRSTT